MEYERGSDAITCKQYLESYPIFTKLMLGFREKYASLGNAGGTVVLRGITEEDIEALEGFFQKNYHGRKSVSISAKQFTKALEESRFSDITLEMLLLLWFDGKIISKKEERQKEEEKRKTSFLEIAEKYTGRLPQKWIEDMLCSQEGAWTFLIRKYKESPEEMQTLLQNGARVLEMLPILEGRTEYLAVFAARVTGDPHYFDHGSEGGTLLKHLIDWYLSQIWKSEMTDKRKHVFPAIRKQKQFLHTGILQDDISNYAILSGVRAWKPEEHKGMLGFCEEGESVQVALATIVTWNRVECPNNSVYVVENPSVYAMLTNEWKGKYACMCMNGQPKLASVLVLDLLLKAGIQIYYAGDFDPEGLFIAQRLKEYCGAALSFWHMDTEAYLRCNPSKPITERRLKMLEKITDEGLIKTAQSIKKLKMAGYQERICEIYLKDIE